MSDERTRIAVEGSEVLEEINAVTRFLNGRIQWVDDDERVRKKMAQFLALGAMFLRFVKENDEDEQRPLLNMASEIAGSITPREPS